MEKKTRIAILFSTSHGRNDGPPLFYLFQLKRLPNTTVDLIDPEGDISGFQNYDYTFWVDYGEDALLGRQKALQLPLPKNPGKTIYVASDTHLDDGYRFEKAKQFDYVFFNQSHAAEAYWDYQQAGQRVDYLPHAAEPLVYNHAGKIITNLGLSIEEELAELEKTKEVETIKKYDICFIGHMQEYHKGNGINMTRVDVLDFMFKKFPNFYYGSMHPGYPGKNMFEDAARHFVESKIVFNISIGNDANMRFFETLATGSFLLTNKIPELESLRAYGFIDGKHYVSYSSLKDAVAKARYFIRNDEEREAIAHMGYEQALKTGTYESRIKEIFKVVGGEKNGQ